MKEQKRKTKIWVGIAAALLAVCGGIAAFTGMNKQGKKPATEDITWADGTMLHLTEEEMPLPINPLNSSYTCSDYRAVLPIESGWFYFQPLRDSNKINTYNDFFLYNDGDVYALSYADRETGEKAVVCAKPNCLHDGNSFCTASTSMYTWPSLTYHDGYLYSLSTKNEDAGPQQVLLRYSPAGTEITELAAFGDGGGENRPVFHRGYLWFIVELSKAGETTENPITGSMQTFWTGGWQLWGYELATGQTVCIYDATVDPTINHVNGVPDGLAASGDYLYFNRSQIQNDRSGPQGLSRISLRTGKEELIGKKGGWCHSISKTHALIGEKENGYAGLTYYLYDLETLEKTEIDKNQVGYSCIDDKYIYSESVSQHNRTDGTPHSIFIYDLEGNLLKEISTGYNCYNVYKELKEGQAEIYSGGAEIIGVQDGVLYMRVSGNGNTDKIFELVDPDDYGVWYCPVEELLSSDNPEWIYAYSDASGTIGNLK